MMASLPPSLEWDLNATRGRALPLHILRCLGLLGMRQVLGQPMVPGIMVQKLGTNAYCAQGAGTHLDCRNDLGERMA